MLFTAGLYPYYFNHLIQDNHSIQPPAATGNNQLTSDTDIPSPSSTSPPSIDQLYSDWLKSLPEMNKPISTVAPKIHPHHPQHLFSSSTRKKKNDQNQLTLPADHKHPKKSSGILFKTPGGTQLVSNWDHQPSDVLDDFPSPVSVQPYGSGNSVQQQQRRFFRSAAAFRTLSPQK